VSKRTPARRRLRAAVRGVVIGALLALAMTGGFAWWLWRQAPHAAPLTSETLAAAEMRWREHGPKSYTLDLKLGGVRPGNVHLEVRDGQVADMTRDGVTPSQRRTWDAWTVDSQFDMIETELAGAAHPERAFGAPPDARVVQRADFDPQLGYPRKYERFVLGTALEISWETVDFRPLADDKTSQTATP
jgi:hypothetical protein